MSHFTVLVIGTNPETQLAPYDENREMPEYIREEVDVDEKVRFIDYYYENHPESQGKSFEELYEIYGEEWNGGCWRKDEDGVWQEFSTYNPDSKWDWYQLGGRWRGFFKAKKTAKSGVLGGSGVFGNEADAGTVDQARKCDIDFESMELEAKEEAEKRYDEVMQVIGHLEPNIPWDKVLEMQELDTPDKKRDFYWKQLRCDAYRKSVNNFGGPDPYLKTREEFVNESIASSYSPYAVVYKGKWIGKGDMGWWGMSSNDKPQGEWNKEVRNLIKSLPGNTLLSLYDCHI